MFRQLVSYAAVAVATLAATASAARAETLDTYEVPGGPLAVHIASLTPPITESKAADASVSGGSSGSDEGPSLKARSAPPANGAGGRFGYSAYAELRLRDHLDVNEKRGRNRFRFRIRLKGELRAHGFFVGLGFRTASSGAAGLTSDNFTVDGSRWPVPELNLAYLGYQRKSGDFSYRVEGGYIYNPFQRNPLLRSTSVIGRRTVQSRRLFDRDYTPMGVAAMATWNLGEARVFATGSAWSFALQHGSNRDVLAGGQAGAVFSFASLAAGFYHLGRPSGELAAYAIKKGNTEGIDAVTGESTGLASEYQILSVSSRVDVGRLVGWKGASLLLEYSRNLAAPAQNNSVYGQLTGKLFRRLKLLLDGFYVEPDAAFASLADSDREFTDVAGFSTAVAWAFSKNFLLTANYFGFWGLHDDLGMQHKVFLSFTMRAGI